jgi:hypothetical protein
MLLTSQRIGEIEEPQSQATDKVEALRQIIAKQEQREVGYEEAQEIGTSLIEFYQVLAEEVCNDPES